MPAKMAWLKQNIASLEMRGKVLVFVATRQAAEELVHLIRRITTAPLDCIHGDKLQYERSEVIARFKKGELRVLIATDVAARGLDVDDVNTGGKGSSRVRNSGELRRSK